MNSNDTNYLNSETLIEYFYNNLCGLSKLEEGYKLYITHDNIITPDEPYMFQGLWRYYNNISRNDAILVITKLFDNIERYYNSLYIKTCILKHKEKKINMPEPIVKEYNLIIEKINNAVYGIKNLHPCRFKMGQYLYITYILLIYYLYITYILLIYYLYITYILLIYYLYINF